MDEIDLLVILVVGCMCSAGCFIFWLFVAHHHQIQAYAGDERSAKRIILPFYQPFIRYFAVLFLILGCCLCLLFSSDEILFSRVLQYYGFLILSIYFLLPSFLLQTSASTKALARTFYQLFPWWFGCTMFWSLSFLADAVFPQLFFSCFLITATAVPVCVCIGILTKQLYSRVQVGSKSNRNTTELVLVFSVVFATYLTLTVSLASVEGNHSNNDDAPYHQRQIILDAVFSCFIFVTNQLFPFALFRTLIADTKFWRGLGKHNQGGINQDETLRQSGIDVHRPTMEMNVISSTFQVMMADNNDITVDFAYLQLDQLIGEGATAKVFRGKLKGKLVAIKLSTPPEITEEVLDVFVAESRIASHLTHRNVVQFLGICVRPPQIGMVFEFCEGGNLKTNLQKQSQHWQRLSSKLHACLDASRGLLCLHNYGYIHRDIKTENFFVGKKWAVKLGDFGEATSVRTRESTKERRMTILGTVSFMAPELVNASRYYDQGIDVYALGTTMWEIWTGKEPYDGCSQFDIYERVRSGTMLEIPEDVPVDVRNLILSMWHADPAQRPTSKHVAEILEKLSHNTSSGEKEEVEEEKSPRLKTKTVSDIEEGDGEGEETEEDVRASVVENPIFRT